MMDSVFLLRCVDCDARGYPSQLWLRASLATRSGRSKDALHYFECMNCGARLKSRQRDRVESVNDAEWRRFVMNEEADLPFGLQRIH